MYCDPMYSPYYYSIPFTRMLTTMTVFIDSSAIAYVVQSVMRKYLLVDLHENLIFTTSTRSLLFQGRCNCKAAKNKWAAIAHEIYTTLVQRTCTCGRTAHIRLPNKEVFQHAKYILCYYHYAIRSCMFLGMISSCLYS